MNFFARYKKLFLILAFLAAVILAAYFLWQLFFKTSSPSTSSENPSGISGNLPSAGLSSGLEGEITGPGVLPGDQSDNILSGLGSALGPNSNEPNDIALGGLTKTTVVSSSSVLDPTVSNNGTVQYYNRGDGYFYRLDKNGNLTKLSDKVFYRVSNITWAPNQNQAILEYPDGSKILYNFNTEKQITLPDHWKEFSFSPSSNQIVAKSLGLDPENNWLVVSNSDSSQAKALEALGNYADTVYPSWSPNNQIVAMYTKGVDFDRQEVFFVGLNDENFKSTIIEGRGFEFQWSTTGDRLLYSVYHTRDDLKPRLWIVDATGDTISQNRRSFDLQTWANKCTFASNTEIYCAVPETLEKGAGLFPELADKTKDDLYKIDLSTGTKKLIAVPDGAYNVSQIMVPGSQDVLYFTDKTTGLLYEVQLK